MVSSKDQAKKISQCLRQHRKKFFEDFYAKAEEAGHHPSPLQAALALGQILERAIEGEWPPQPSDRPGVSTEVFDLVTSKFFQEGFDEAVGAYGRHTPGLEIKKGKPGRKLNVELAERIWALKAEGKTNRVIQETLNTSGENLSLDAVESYLKARRRARKQ